MTQFILLLMLGIAQTCLNADTVSTALREYRSIPYIVQHSILSRDGTQRIEACRDGVLRFSRVRDSVVQREISVCAASLGFVIYTPDYAAFIAAAWDSTAYRVDAVSGIVEKLTIAKEAVWFIKSFSGDGGKCIAYVPADSTRMLCDLKTGEHRILGGIKGDSVRVHAVLTPDAQAVMRLGSLDSTIRITRAADDSLLHTCRISGYVRYGAFSPDGARMVIPVETNVANERFVALLMDVGSGETVWRATMQAKGNALPSWDCANLAFSSDGARLLAGDGDMFILWDASTGKQLASQNHENLYDRFTYRFSADGQSLLLNWSNSGACADSIAELDIATQRMTMLYGIQNWPRIDGWGFSGTGEDLYIGNYYYDSLLSVATGFTEWDSLVFWCGATNREFMKRIYVRNEPGDQSYFNWVFSNDGRLLIQFDCEDGEINAVSIRNLADGGAVAYSRRFSTPPLVSPDKRYLWMFSDSIWLQLDLQTLDSVKGTFAIPDSWEIKAVDPQTKSVCAFQMRQKSTFDTVFIRAAIWNLETGQGGEPFTVNMHHWSDDYMNVEAVFLSDANSIAVYDDTRDTIAGLRLFDTRTGKNTFTFPGVRGRMELFLTPDRGQLLVGCATPSVKGVYSFDTRSGELLRYYNMDYAITSTHICPFSCNPADPRQFMYRNKIWELPRPVSISEKPQCGRPSAFRMNSATARRISFTVPTGAEPATVNIHRLDGRSVARMLPATGQGADRTVMLPDLAHGVYLYRVNDISGALIARGIFTILK